MNRRLHFSYSNNINYHILRTGSLGNLKYFSSSMLPLPSHAVKQQYFFPLILYIHMRHCSLKIVSIYFKLFRENDLQKLVQLHDFRTIITTEHNLYTYNTTIGSYFLHVNLLNQPRNAERCTITLTTHCCHNVAINKNPSRAEINANLPAAACTLSFCSAKFQVPTTSHKKTLPITVHLTNLARCARNHGVSRQHVAHSPYATWLGLQWLNII
jgi:hypothetical protein